MVPGWGAGCWTCLQRAKEAYDAISPAAVAAAPVDGRLREALEAGRDALVDLAPALDRVGVAIIEGGPLDIIASELDHVVERLEVVIPQMGAALAAPVDDTETGPQRQDSLLDQLRDVLAAAERMGCRDAADWIKRQSSADTYELLAHFRDKRKRLTEALERISKAVKGDGYASPALVALMEVADAALAPDTETGRPDERTEQ
jgi:hypothetical protein